MHYFSIVARFDVRRSDKQHFSTAIVSKVDSSGEKTRIKFHFAKTSTCRDEWIDIGSDRIAVYGSKTRTAGKNLDEENVGPVKVNTKDQGTLYPDDNKRPNKVSKKKLKIKKSKVVKISIKKTKASFENNSTKTKTNCAVHDTIENDDLEKSKQTFFGPEESRPVELSKNVGKDQFMTDATDTVGDRHEDVNSSEVRRISIPESSLNIGGKKVSYTTFVFTRLLFLIFVAIYQVDLMFFGRVKLSIMLGL